MLSGVWIRGTNEKVILWLVWPLNVMHNRKCGLVEVVSKSWNRRVQLISFCGTVTCIINWLLCLFIIFGQIVVGLVIFEDDHIGFVLEELLLKMLLGHVFLLTSVVTSQKNYLARSGCAANLIRERNFRANQDFC